MSQIPAKVIAVYLCRLSSLTKAIEKSPAKKKRRVKPVKNTEVTLLWATPQQQLSCTAALLEVLAWLPNIEDRYCGLIEGVQKSLFLVAVGDQYIIFSTLCSNK